MEHGLHKAVQSGPHTHMHKRTRTDTPKNVYFPSSTTLLNLGGVDLDTLQLKPLPQGSEGPEGGLEITQHPDPDLDDLI